MRILSKLFREWPDFLVPLEPDPADVRARIAHMERNVGSVVRGVVIAGLLYYFFFSSWFEEGTNVGDVAVDVPPREQIQSVLKRFFLIYVVLNAGYISLLSGMSQLPLSWLQRTTFVMGAIDSVFVGTLVVATGGFDSLLYWAFLGLIVRNAISHPDVWRQLVLNLFVAATYVAAGVLDVVLDRWQLTLFDERVVRALDATVTDSSPESSVLRFTLLLLMTFCCAGVQFLIDKQRRVEQEAREFAIRQQQFEATGRLAAEIAHQLKNPLGIINNAAFTLQRTMKEGKTITQQISIIREEVDRSDRIITELMGYARLSEGRIEKLDVAEVLDHAVEQSFPPAAKYDIEVRREYAAALPALLMQRGHLSEVFMNLLVNARQAMQGRGIIRLSVRPDEDYCVLVRISDNGPGIRPDHLARIFEPYFTTKEKGSGLGLAIVRHNTEIYGGTVTVESELGKGTTFTIKLPAKTLIKIRK